MSSRTSEQRLQTTCLLIVSGLAIGWACYLLRAVLVPFVLAIFFTYCLSPVVDLQRRYLKMPRIPAILITIILGCVILSLMALVVSASVSQMANHADQYQAQFRELLTGLTEQVPLEKLGIPKEVASTTILQNLQSTVGSMVSGTISAILNVLSRGMLVLVFMIFMLLGRKGIGKVKKGIWSEVETRIRTYILTLLLISAFTGLLVGSVLGLLGVDFALAFGVSAFFLNFIPSIGSILATLLPLPVVLLDPEFTVLLKCLAFGVPGLIQFGLGSLLAPKVMGDSLDLHPVAILSALIFFGVIWGIMGMFLATPITAVAKILLERIEQTRPAAALLAGRIDGLSAPSKG